MTAFVTRTRDIRWKYGAAGSLMAAGLSTTVATVITTTSTVSAGQPGHIVALHGLAVTAGVVGSALAGKTWLSEKQRLDMLDKARTGQSEVPPSMTNEPLPSKLRGKPGVLRLLNIAANISDALLPVYDAFVLEDDGTIAEYAFRSVTPGLLSSTSMQNKIAEGLRAALPGTWAFEFDTLDDSFAASSKTKLPPSQCAPVPHLVTSVEEAAARWNDATIPIGVGVDGMVTISMRDIFHRLVIGVTGGGKSVFVRDQLTAYLAWGAQLFISDGKGTDYIPLRNVPNISAMGLATRSIQDYVTPILMAARILNYRRARGEAMAAAGDNSWRTMYHPVLLIVDEWENSRLDMKANMDKKEVARIDKAIESILKVGREFRVYLMLSTQSMYNTVVPNGWRDMCQMVMSLGKLAPMTISKSFSDELTPEVQRVSASMPAKAKGRAMIAEVPEEGPPRVRQIQTFWTWTPAESLDDPNAQRLGLTDEWRKHKSAVYDRLPQLYPRMWLDMDAIREAPPKSVAESLREGWIDVGAMTIEDIEKAPLTHLDTRLEDGTFVVNEQARVSDPLDPAYLGRRPATDMAREDAIFDMG